MAIKGKKKSQSRGSQARRRPAAAPRPVITSRARTPWYKTPGGRAIGVIVVLTVLGVVVWAVGNARSNAKDLEQRQEALDDYTDSLRSLLQSVSGPASQMATAPAAGSQPDAAALEELSDASKSWTSTLEESGTIASTTSPAPGMESVNRLFAKALSLFRTAALTYGMAVDADGKLLDGLLQRAAEARSLADEIWIEAIAILDDERADADMELSGLRAPSLAPAGGPPTPLPTVIPEVDQGGGGSKKTTKDGSGDGDKEG